MAVKLKDVAEKVGLSVPTVSEILRNDPHSRIASDTRKRVVKAAKELGYSHNMYARVLSTGKSRLIGLLIDTLNVEIGLAKLQAVDVMVRENGYSAAMRVGMEALKDFSSQMAEGIIAVQGILTPSYDIVSHLISQGVHVVSMEPVPGMDVDYVTVDRRYGVYVATKHLIEAGHSKIAFLHGDLAGFTTQQRLQGYREALEESGLRMDDRLMMSHEGSGGPVAGQDCTKALLSRRTGLTALICNNDYLAFGAMAAIFEAGLRIPEDVAVVGFDNLALSAYAPVPLTTVEQPVHEIARLATELLFGRIEGTVTGPKQTIAVKPTLVIRESSVIK